MRCWHKYLLAFVLLVQGCSAPTRQIDRYAGPWEHGLHADLPHDPSEGQVFILADATSRDDCSAGGGAGTTPAVCRWNGNRWEPFDTFSYEEIRLETGRILDVTSAEFGATGDGTTNDTAGIQAAFDSLPAGGGSISFPPGTYVVTPPEDQGPIFVLPAKPVRLIGAGIGATTIKVRDSSRRYSSIFDGARNDVTSLEVAGITFDHNIENNGFRAAPNKEMNEQRTFFVGESRGVHIHDIEVKNASSYHNIYAVGELITIENNLFHGIGKNPHGVRHDSSIINLAGKGRHLIRNNVIRGAGPDDAAAPGQWTAIETHGSDTVVVGNRVENMRRLANLTGSGTIQDTYNVVASGNTCDGCGQGIMIWSNASAGAANDYGMSNVAVTGNTIRIALSGTWKNSGGGNLTPFGILLQADAQLPVRGIAIVGNTIRATLESRRIKVTNPNRAGIGWAAARNRQLLKDSVIKNNVIDAFPLSAIRLKCNVENVEIVDNMISNAGNSRDGSARLARKTPISIQAGALSGLVVAGNTIGDDSPEMQPAFGVYLEVATTSTDLRVLDNVVSITSANRKNWVRPIQIKGDVANPLIRGRIEAPNWQGNETIRHGSRYVDPRSGVVYVIDPESGSWVESPGVGE